jgi:hypothetical protein
MRFCNKNTVLKKKNYFKLFFSVFIFFLCANIKINFKKSKKYFFDGFSRKKHFKKQLLPQSQIHF